MSKFFFKVVAIIILCNVLTYSGIAQTKNQYQGIIDNIDSLASLGLPKSALAEIEKLDNLSRKNNNVPQQVKAVIYRMTFQSYLEENALEAIITRLKADITKAEYPVKPVLQSLLAEIYWKYYQQNRYQFSRRSVLEKSDSDFTRWDLKTLINEVSALYKLSLSNPEKEQQTPVNILDGILVGDSTTRNLRPTLYDLLAHRALDFFLNEESDLLKPKMPFSLTSASLFDSNQDFANTAITTTDTSSISYKGIKLLQEITRFHLKNTESEALADINLKRLNFIYRKSVHPDKDSLYLRSLKQFIQSFTNAISADALVSIGQFYQQKDSLTLAKYYLDKALADFQNSLGSKNAAALISTITQKEISVSLENVNIPAKPILALLNYRNLNRVEYKLYKLSDKQLEEVHKLDERGTRWRDGTIQPTDALLNYLNNQNVLRKETIPVINPGDFRKHSTEFKLDALEPGDYLLLNKDAENDVKSLMNMLSFKVSNLAYSSRITPSGEFEIRTLNRETGAPLGNVSVTLKEIQYSSNIRKDIVLGTGLSDGNGKFTLAGINRNGKQTYVSLSLSGDRFHDDVLYLYGTLLSNSNDDETDRTILFTDRQIYRPGQTIYFKGIQIIQSKRKSEIVIDELTEVAFKDANRKEISTLKLKTNEFGTIAGSFIIPQNTLNGRFTIETDDGSIQVQVEEYKRPTFQVELDAVKESYRLNDSIPLKGRVMAFSGYGISQASVAYKITRRRTDYQNFRYGYFNTQTEIISDTTLTDNAGNFNITFKAVPEDLVSQNELVYSYLLTVDVTDASGETRSSSTSVAVGDKAYIINFSLPQKLLASDDRIIIGNPGLVKSGNTPLYVIDGVPSDDIKSLSPFDIVRMDVLKDAAATAIYGARAANGAVIITTKSGNKSPNTTEIRSLQIPVNLSNLNNQKLDGSIQVKIYSLKSPDKIVIKRLWDRPDMPFLTKEEFNKLFPYYEYQDENNESTWQKNKLVAERKLKISADKTDFLDLSFMKKQASGSYKVEVSAVNSKGDTASLNLYTYLIAGPANAPGKIENWILPVKTSVVPGESAEFLMGLGEGSKILMETYEGAELRSSKWLSIGEKQELIKVPVELNSNQFSVQFLTVFQNRLLSSYQRITLRQYPDDLDIRFLTFRDKLQPGEKEQWKLQIQSKDKQAAEMIAALYDASLDDVSAAQNWQYRLDGFDNYSPGYFTWNQNGFIKRINSLPFEYPDNNFPTVSRQYEMLDFMGYNYYGGYNYAYQQYLSRLKDKERIAESDKKLEAKYLKNAALIKKGFDISGTVSDGSNRMLPGVVVSIKGSQISITTNSKGYFKIKVPEKAVLVFTYLGFETAEVNAKEGESIKLKLKETSSSLNEVVVVGYGTQKKSELTGAVSTVSAQALQRMMTSGDPAGGMEIRIRGASSLTEDNGVYDMASVEGASIDKPKEITIRKNFNETAFFYPQLRTNAKGEILIDFTIPEALTRWRFKGFAHTKELQTGYIEKEIVTQKSLMISANMPRFFREGDTISVSARIANLTDKTIKGTAAIQLFNALTMQPVALLANPAQASQVFDVEKSSNKAVSYKLIIPKGLDAITYRLTADGGDFSDGEENTIPVLPNSMLVTESMPMMVRAGQSKTFTLKKLVNNSSTTLQNKTLTLEYTQNPVWYAVQALPYLMEYPYECSEQIFSRYFANTLAGTIVQRLPKIKAVFDNWKNTNSEALTSNLEKNQELKSVLLEETPWLRNAETETEQKNRIALLFDLNKMSNELTLNMEKLAKMQRSDGGFPWFTGSNYSDRYISQHILAGMGQLTKLADIKTDQAFKNISSKALSYVDNQLVEDYKDALIYEKKHTTKPEDISSITLHALYVRSYFPDATINANLKAAFNYFLPKVSVNWKSKNVYQQAISAFIMQRNNKPAIATSIIRSLKETAQQSEELGMYWAKNQVGYYWYQSPIETQALLIELFSETGSDAKSVEEMKIWLLRNKQTTNWKTTKATAAACYSLLLRGGNLIESDVNSEILLGGQSLAVLKPEVKSEAGTGYLKTSWTSEQISPSLGTVELKNSSKTISWGAVHWQYLENLDKITSAETQLKLERKYFIQKQTDAGPKLTEVDNSHLPKTGDILKVIVYLNADRDYEYIHLKDMRPSGTEPSDILSGYKYQERFYYYQVTKDVATNFFINYLPKGKYVFEYNLRVVQPGNYSTGISTIECLYAPEFNAHSKGSRMKIE